MFHQHPKELSQIRISDLRSTSFLSKLRKSFLITVISGMLCTSILFSLLTLITHSAELTGSENFHKIARGESLEYISRRYKVPLNRLLRINDIESPGSIETGENLRITAKRILPQYYDNGLIINLPEYSVYHFEDGKLINTYPIAIGMRNWQTPRGEFRVTNKVTDPTWKIPPRIAKKYNYDKELIPPGPENPLGKYWIGLSLPHIGLHSTNNPETVGLPISHGCMRLYLDDAETMYNSVETGTRGRIIYEPVKVAVEDHSIFLEVHDDVYQLIGDLRSHTDNILTTLGVKNFVDMEKVEGVIQKRNGMPVNISISKIINIESEIERSESKRLWNSMPK